MNFAIAAAAKALPALMGATKGATAIKAATAFNAGSQMLQGWQGYQQGRYDAKVARRNADLARLQAQQEAAASALSMEAGGRDRRRALGEQAAATAQSGGGTQGSAGRVLTQSSQEAALDELNQKHNLQVGYQGGIHQSALYDHEANMARKRATGSLVSGVIGAGAAVLNGRSAYGSHQRSTQVMGAEMGRLNSRYGAVGGAFPRATGVKGGPKRYKTAKG